MTPPNEVVWAGIDTHTDTHTIALLDERGRPLGAETFTADPDGYDRLIGMLPGPGRVAAVGVEGTNSFGAALARRLTAAGYEVREVLRPRRSVRRRDGKSDPLDAVCFASMFVRQVRQCFSAVWADGFPRCRHRFPVM